MSFGRERRRHTRVTAERLMAALTVDGADLGQVSIRDVSATGVFVRHPSPILPRGTQVTLRLAASFRSPPLLVTGRIVRIVTPEGSLESGYGIELSDPPDALLEACGLNSPPGDPRTRDLRPLELPIESDAVLIVEDDVDLGRAMVRIFEALGLGAHCETHAANATPAFVSRRASIRLAVVDLLLPDGSGEDVVRQLKKERPNLPVLVTSAFSKTVAGRKNVLAAGANAFLAKPFHREDLCRAALSLLGRDR